MLWEFITITKSTRGARLWKNKLKEKKLAEKRAKKNAKTGFVKNKDEDKTIPLDQVITLDHLLIQIKNK